MVIRPPTGKDFGAIRDVLDAAFGEEGPSRIVDGVRAEGVAMVELVADEAGQIMGYILFSRMTTNPPARITGLGPVGVRPDQQNLGIGDALCRAGIEQVRALGADAVVVLGHESYYPRFGFSHAAVANVASPYAERPAFMGLELTAGSLGGPVKVDYPRAFV